MSAPGQIIRPREGDRCPMCGGAIDPLIARIGSVLSRRQMQLFFILQHADAPMTCGQLVAALFDEEDQGGHDWADGIVTTAIARMRSKIRQHELPLRLWTAPMGYRLEVLAA